MSEARGYGPDHDGERAPGAGADRVAATVRSLDGTPIAYERTGGGPPVIMMGGALNDKNFLRPLAGMLAQRFTVWNYDRRGRGESGDTPPYSLDREVEDLDRMLAEAGGSAALFANCSGGAVGIEAAARGLPITKLAMYEPPFILDGQRPPLPPDFVGDLARLVGDGRRGDAVRYFMAEVVRLPEPVIEKISNGPMWPWLESLAPSLPYDTSLMSDTSLPADLLARVKVPTLVVDGGDSPQWQRNSVQAVAEIIERGRRHTLPGQNHNLAMDLVAPVLEEFFADPAG
jgi:Alpha/beta hydrolase family